jgi:hypothetical protein
MSVRVFGLQSDVCWSIRDRLPQKRAFDIVYASLFIIVKFDGKQIHMFHLPS